MEEELKTQQILQKSHSLQNIYSHALEKKKREIQKGIDKEDILNQLKKMPELNIKNKFSETIVKLIFGKILHILFPNHLISSDDGKNYLIRKISFQESFLRGTVRKKKIRKKKVKKWQKKKMSKKKFDQKKKMKK